MTRPLFLKSAGVLGAHYASTPRTAPKAKGSPRFNFGRAYPYFAGCCGLACLAALGNAGLSLTQADELGSVFYGGLAMTFGMLGTWFGVEWRDRTAEEARKAAEVEAARLRWREAARRRDELKALRAERVRQHKPVQDIDAELRPLVAKMIAGAV